jgi:hypothetical protein
MPRIYDSPMRALVPVLVAVFSIAIGVWAGEIRSRAGADPELPIDPGRRRRVRRVSLAVWAGLLVLGVALLAIGWRAWGSAPVGTSPQAFSWVAYTAAALELFSWGMLAGRVMRRDRPPLTP